VAEIPIGLALGINLGLKLCIVSLPRGSRLPNFGSAGRRSPKERKRSCVWDISLPSILIITLPCGILYLSLSSFSHLLVVDSSHEATVNQYVSGTTGNPGKRCCVSVGTTKSGCRA